jgi:antitoxin MazE
MKAQIIQIGNSRGIRIPKAILQQCDMSDEVDVAVEGRQIILSPAGQQPRKGCREAAARMAAAGDDELFIPDAFADEIDLEWK